MSRRFRRVLRLPFLRPAEHDVDDEFGYHIDMRSAELERAGLSPEAARDEALRQFGDIDEARRYCGAEDRRRARGKRRATWLGDLRGDVTVAARTLWHQPAFTFTTVIVLAIANAIAASAYGVAHAYLIRPLPYPQSDRLVQILAGPSREPFPNAPRLSNVRWEAVDSVFDATVAWDLDGFTLAGDARPELVDGAWISRGYFSALGLRPAVGRAFRPEEYDPAGTRVAIISDALWSRRYNRDPSIIGRAIRAHSTDRPNESELVTIVGVMPAGAWHVSRFTEVLRPLTAPRMPSMAKLKDGMTIADAERRMNAIVLPQLDAFDPAWRMSLVGVQSEYTAEVRPILVALLGAAAFLLLIGGANVAGAQVARAVGRRAEMQVRIALGASRGRIVRQLLAENLVLAGAAALIGVMVANVTLGAAGAVVGEQLRTPVPGGPSHLAPGGVVLAVAVLGGALIGIAFGVVPALMAARGDAAAAIRDAGRETAVGAAPARLRRILIGAQVAFTMMLLVGAGLMARTAVAIARAPLGFDETNVTKGTILLPLGHYPNATARRQGINEMLAALAATPGVTGAAIASPHPFRGEMQRLPVIVEGAQSHGGAGPRAVQYVVTPEFFRVLRVPLVSGRGFDRADGAESNAVAVISADLARLGWPSATAIGKRLRIGSDTVWRTVIGVSGETREIVAADQAPDIYVPYAQLPRAYVSVLVRTSAAPERMLPLLPRVVGGVADVLALADVETMSTVVDRDGQRARALATVLAVLAVFALGLAVLGLYSALAYVVFQRRREIAIRAAIGADARRIALLVLREGGPLIASGLLAGTGLSLTLTRVLRSQLYGVAEHDVVTFGLIAAMLAVSGLGALLIPARQAVRVDPAAVLRAE